MGKEFVGEDGGVAVDFDEVDGEGGDFGKHYAAEGVGEGEGGVLEDKVDGCAVGLEGGALAVTESVVNSVCSLFG